MSDIKDTQETRVDAVLKTAEDCLDLAKTQHEAAEAQHQIAARIDANAQKQRQNADEQQKIATAQRKTADRLDSSAEKLDAIGRAITKDIDTPANAASTIVPPRPSSALLEKMERVRH
jgi:hypothetical protein